MTLPNREIEPPFPQKSVCDRFRGFLAVLRGLRIAVTRRFPRARASTGIEIRDVFDEATKGVSVGGGDIALIGIKIARQIETFWHVLLWHIAPFLSSWVVGSAIGKKIFKL